MSSKLSPTQERLREVGLREPQAEAFAFADELHDITYEWHTHACHQLLYSFSGLTKLETPSRLWLLPPQRAAWIPAGLRHRTTLHRVTSGSIYFLAARFAFTGLDQIAVFTATPLLREMIAFGMRWKNQPRGPEPLADHFFQTVAFYCGELARTELPYSLPQGSSKGVRAAIAHTVAHLEAVTLPEVCHAAAASPRSLRRHFLVETGLTWRQFLTRARLLRALELLTEGQTNVTETAYACGFSNLSAFSEAFQTFTGENPAAFRRNRLKR